MAFNTYDLGDLVRLTAEFSDPFARTPIDPDTIKLSYKAPDGTLTTLVYGTDVSLVRDDVGVYYVDVGVDQAGTWYYRGFSEGTGMAAEERRFTVRGAMAVAS